MTIKGLMTAIPLLLAGWLGTLSIVAIATDEAPSYVVLLPSQDLWRNLPQEVAIVSATSFSVTLASEKSGFARELYRQGARIVLPAGLPGCKPRPQES